MSFGKYICSLRFCSPSRGVQQGSEQGSQAEIDRRVAEKVSERLQQFLEYVICGIEVAGLSGYNITAA